MGLIFHWIVIKFPLVVAGLLLVEDQRWLVDWKGESYDGPATAEGGR